MTRILKDNKLVIASHNAGKVREIAALLAAYRIEVVGAGELGLTEPEETGDSFVANARLKAHSASQVAKMPALADDSGLAVAALGGAPGIYSARWAGPEKDFLLAMNRVHEAVRETNDGDPEDYNDKAAFICALCLAWPDGGEEVFEGRVDGRLVWPPRGEKGFGYDPMFIPDGGDKTFGEIDPAQKHRISHRARAFTALADSCFKPRA